MDEPKLIPGGLHVDERGVVSFVNDFDFQGVRRFYTIRAHVPNQLRGWVGHKTEHKWFTAVVGSILIAVVRPDNWENPSRDLPIQRFVLSALKPAILHVPAGHATASVMLGSEATLMVFSSGRIDQAPDDEYRYRLSLWSVVARAQPQ